MIISKELEEKLDYYEQAYFSTDDPVPFRGGLKIYPVLSKDYYKFYSCLPAFTMDKNVKKVKVVDEKGVEQIKEVSNPQGIAMSHMGYLIDCMENPDYGQAITQQVVGMFEMVFREENGLYCPKCGRRISQKEILSGLLEFEDSLDKDLDEDSKNRMRQIYYLKLMTCPEEGCGGTMQDVYRIKNSTPKKLCILDIELSSKDYEEMVGIITHGNILDYKDDKYIDPDLKKDLELKAKLENSNYSTPSLEKQLVGVTISTAYTIDYLKEHVTLRKLAWMLRLIDKQKMYYAQIQGSMSGMVTFKTEPTHWLFGEDKKDMSKEIMTLNDVQRKFANVT